MTKFQIIVISIFVLFIVVGVTMFATFKGDTTQTALPPITMWGTLPSSDILGLIQDINLTLPQALRVTYIEKTEANFDRDFIEELARGQGPDVILIPQEMLFKHEDKLTPIPYSIITERSYRDTFIQEAELYLTTAGSLAVPFSVDPIVMYWNRDMYTNAGFSTYPTIWNNFGEAVNRITQKDANGNIRRSAVALGEFSNINHAREIFGTLLMQAGTPVTKRLNVDIGTSVVGSALGDSGLFQGSKNTGAGLTFFTRFSDPNDEGYSWNRSLPPAKSSFLSGALATYFGYASELGDIRSKNPNIDFDVAPIPQAKDAKERITYGKMYGFSVVRSSPNQGAASSVIGSLVTADALSKWEARTYLPPVRRDMITRGTTDPYLAIFYDSALISHAWIDPNSAKTTAIFRDMVESVTSGKSGVASAVRSAHDQLNLLIGN